jgi:hypothetical protein
MSMIGNISGEDHAQVANQRFPHQYLKNNKDKAYQLNAVNPEPYEKIYAR